jgi:hypothetical protein
VFRMCFCDVAFLIGFLYMLQIQSTVTDINFDCSDLELTCETDAFRYYGWILGRGYRPTARLLSA